jgi:sarcosine oxidase subunit beta
MTNTVADDETGSKSGSPLGDFMIDDYLQPREEDIEWVKGGYCFVAYRTREEKILKDLLAIQKSFGLNISWLEKKELLDLVPDFNPEGLIGGTYSPEDGNASPLLAVHYFYLHAKRAGAEFHFSEPVVSIKTQSGRIVSLRTPLGKYSAPIVINASGAWANNVSQLLGLSVPVKPDSHESAVTEPVAPFLVPMVVDIRPAPGSSNYYFYQHATGQVIFCITPNPNIWGENIQETSDFLPMVAKRIINLMPRLTNIRVRRTWRGLYPMTPDGSPLLGRSREVEGFIQAVGMCGQGFMLGPGIAELLERIIINSLTEEDDETLDKFSLYRDFQSQEMLR